LSLEEPDGLQDASPPGPPLQARWKRRLWLGLGMFFVALGAVGVVTPILPTTPFLLLASFFFLRSSPRHHAWLRRSPLFGPLLADWDRHRGVRKRTKIVAVGLTVSAAGISLLLTDLSPALMVLVAALVASGVVVILRLPTIDEPGSRR
jgi:uncharacterized protein